jgi:gas vesicle protein
MSDCHNDNSFFLGVILGAVIGAGAVFLFGTEKGEEVRGDLRDRGEDLLEDLTPVIKQLEEKGQEIKKSAEKTTRQLVKKAGQVEKEVSSEAVEKISDTLEQLENLQEKGRQATADLRKRYFIKNGRKLS